jgi:hypothetical protein
LISDDAAEQEASQRPEFRSAQLYNITLIFDFRTSLQGIEKTKNVCQYIAQGHSNRINALGIYCTYG